MITMRNHNYCGKLCGIRGKVFMITGWRLRLRGEGSVRYSRNNCGSKMWVFGCLKDNWNRMVAPGVVSRDSPQVFVPGSVRVGLRWPCYEIRV